MEKIDWEKEWEIWDRAGADQELSWFNDWERDPKKTLMLCAMRELSTGYCYYIINDYIKIKHEL